MNVTLLTPASSPGLQVDDLPLEASPLRPAEIHAQQHLRPVLRLGAAGAGVNGHDRILGVVLAAEHLLNLGRLDPSRQVIETLGELVADIFTLTGPIH